MASSLKIGFIVDDEKQVPAWYFETIKTVVEKGCAVFFIVHKAEKRKHKAPLFFRLFKVFEERWFRSAFDALRPVSLHDFLNPQNSIRLKENLVALPSRKEIERLQLDVLYTVESLEKEQRELLSKTTKQGLWQPQFGRNEYAHANLPAFWEVMNNDAVTESRLLIYKEGKTFIAYEGTTLTVPYSVKNNFNAVAWKASSYLLHRLRTLEEFGDAFFTNLPLSPTSEPAKKFPRNTKMIFLALRNIVRYSRYKLKRKSNRFTLFYSLEKFNPENLYQTHFIPLPLPRKNVFYADPFVVEKDDMNYIFFEEMDEANGKAHICVFTVGENKEFSEPRMVLEKPYHLSYPFVFFYEGHYYMIPETASNKTVELYKATDFPYQWEFVMNLMENVTLFDATLHFAAGKWWLFASGHNHSFTSTNDQLFLFYSDELFSTRWTAHPQNPVATNAGNCRPAGRIFRYGNKLYRPAQNNASQQYGYGLKMNEIEVLNETTYGEKEALSVLPEALGLLACHHLDFSSSLIVIDGILR